MFIMAVVFGVLCGAVAHVAHAKPVDPADSIEIVGGSKVSASDPIAATTVGLSDGNTLCTASLIDDDIAVTAAHCVDGVDMASLEILYGTSILTSKAKKARVLGALANPGWQGDASSGVDEHDIAVVRFEGGLPKGYAKAKILEDSSGVRAGDSVTLAGYGITNAASQAGAGVLRKVDVTVVNPDLGKTEIVFDQSSGHGACHGDSGGPAFVKQGSSLLLLGLTNRGYPDDAPDDCLEQSVYTKISAYLNWIQSAVSTLRKS
ncbi:MAG: S1 family peptidase [Bdellovibrionota bacterium]